MSFVLSPEAEADLWDVWEYLAREAGKDVADQIEADILSAAGFLSTAPGSGHLRPDLTDHSVFFFAVYSYLIVYAKRQPLQIVAILHGRRNVEDVLSERKP